MSLSILISDPDKVWGETLKTFFNEKKFKVDSGLNGKDTQLLVYKNKYQVALLDIDVENHSWLEVLRYIKLNAPEVKVIFTLSNSQKLKKLEITENDLRRMGVSEVLVKPLRPENIFNKIESEYRINSWEDIKCTAESKDEEQVNARDEEFTHIRFDNFYSGSTTIYDHYIRLGKNSFVKILHQGETFESIRMKKYIDAKVDYLYFKTSDRTTYINFTNKLLSRIIGTNVGTIEKKMKTTHSVVEKYLEQVFSSGLKPSLIQEGYEICQNMFNLIQKEPELNECMKTYQDYDPPSYAHLFLVSFFSIITCKNLDWASVRTTEMVAMAALLHDIGMLKLPPSLLTKKISSMTAIELALYKTHPKLGSDMLSKYPTIPESVKQIVYQHHEYTNGEGFPNKLNGLKIYPPAKIVSLNNDFVEFIIENNLTPLKGIRQFIQEKTTLVNYDPLILKALVTGFVKG